MKKIVDTWIYTPLLNFHTGIKIVRNWSTESKTPKPCFRCYLVGNYCSWCHDEIKDESDTTYCSWEQFKINANWKHYPGGRCPKTEREYAQLQGNIPVKPTVTFSEYKKIQSRLRHKSSRVPCLKDTEVHRKSIRILNIFNPGWQETEIALIPIPSNYTRKNKKRKLEYAKKFTKKLCTKKLLDP